MKIVTTPSNALAEYLRVASFHRHFNVFVDADGTFGAETHTDSFNSYVWVKHIEAFDPDDYDMDVHVDSVQDLLDKAEEVAMYV